MPKISVIVPVYNTEKYLPATLKFIAEQTFSDMEIIFVNDCSTDNSLALLQEYASNDKRVKILNNEKNSGAAISRNKGIEAAQGEYLLFLDADDLFEPTLVADVVARIELSGADIVIFNYDRTNSSKKINLKKCRKVTSKLYFSPDEIPKRIFNIGPPNAFSKCFKRSLIENNNIRFQNLKSCNDVYFTIIALALAEKISILDKVLIHYRTDAQNNITSKRGSYYENIIKAMEEVKNALVKAGKYEKYKKSFIRAFKNSIRYEYKFISKENIPLFIDYCKEKLGQDWSIYKTVTYPTLIQKILRLFE